MHRAARCCDGPRGAPRLPWQLCSQCGICAHRALRRTVGYQHRAVLEACLETCLASCFAAAGAVDAPWQNGSSSGLACCKALASIAVGGEPEPGTPVSAKESVRNPSLTLNFRGGCYSVTWGSVVAPRAGLGAVLRPWQGARRRSMARDWYFGLGTAGATLIGRRRVQKSPQKREKPVQEMADACARRHRREKTPQHYPAFTSSQPLPLANGTAKSAATLRAVSLAKSSTKCSQASNSLRRA